MKEEYPAAALPNVSPFRAILLDDNADDCEHFRLLLRRHPSIQLLGETDNFKQALELINSKGANILFLESELERQSMMDECRLVPPHVKLIFITRYPSFAVRAFELDALDFLLKPLFSSRFNETVRRLLRIDWKRASPPEIPETGGASLLIPFERGRRGASLNEITLIQAFGNYTRIMLAGRQSEIVLRSLSKWGQTLPSSLFLRVHRNAIVNIRRVVSLEENAGGHALRIDGVAEKIPISRRCLPEVRSALFAIS